MLPTVKRTGYVCCEWDTWLFNFNTVLFKFILYLDMYLLIHWGLVMRTPEVG